MGLCGYNEEMLTGLLRFAVGKNAQFSKNLKTNTMAICGFNQEMLNAEEQFAGGLWTQLLNRADEEQKSLTQTLQIEIDEMNQFEEFLRATSSPEEVDDVLGIVLFARSLYRQCLKAGGTHEAYIRLTSASVQRQFEMDDYYYKILRPKHGPIVGLEKLAEYLEERPLK